MMEGAWSFGRANLLWDHCAMVLGLGPPSSIDAVRLLLVPIAVHVVVIDDLFCLMVYFIPCLSSPL